MAVKIRLRRQGRLNYPFFRICVADARSPIRGGYIENIGWYEPTKPSPNFKIDLERADFWVGRGAKASETVASFMRQARRNPLLRKASATPYVAGTATEDAAGNPEIAAPTA